MPQPRRTRPSWRRELGLVALWLACAVTAATVSVAAVSVVRAAVRDEPVQVLSPTDVATALHDAGPTLQPLSVAAQDADELEQEWEDAAPTPSPTRADDADDSEDAADVGRSGSGSDDRSGSGPDDRPGSADAGRSGSGSDDRSGSGSGSGSDD